jgi:hypothetical protein
MAPQSCRPRPAFMTAVLVGLHTLSVASTRASDPSPEDQLWGPAVSELACSIRTAKSEYAVGEPIPIELLLRNQGKAPLTVIRPRLLSSYDVPFVAVQVTGPEGPCRYHGVVHSKPLPLLPSSYVELSLNEVAGAAPGEDGSLRIVPKDWGMLKPGRYELHYVFASTYKEYWKGPDERVSVSAWTGQLKSNTLAITVVENGSR